MTEATMHKPVYVCLLTLTHIFDLATSLRTCCCLSCVVLQAKNLQRMLAHDNIVKLLDVFVHRDKTLHAATLLTNGQAEMRQSRPVLRESREPRESNDAPPRKDFVCITMEYCDGGSLYDVVNGAADGVGGGSGIRKLVVSGEAITRGGLPLTMVVDIFRQVPKSVWKNLGAFWLL